LVDFASESFVSLADEAMEDALYDNQALRGFAGIDLSVASVPDATTVLNFRHWLEEHNLTGALFDADHPQKPGHFSTLLSQLARPCTILPLALSLVELPCAVVKLIRD
jgi:hypothetical protein